MKNWIRSGIKIGQAVKNVQRLRVILGVFAKHGFSDVAVRMKLERYLPSRWAVLPEADHQLSVPVRMRMAFEELGPTFVKLGQLLSTRPDLVPENFIEEFTKLQDTVQELPFEVVKGVVEGQLKRPLSEAFKSFSEKPLAAASIGQVHEAVLLTDEKVVVKVQRPDIDRIIRNDIALLGFLAGLLENYVPETRILRPQVIVDEFFRTLNFEVDFIVEANNMVKIAENMASFTGIVVPKVYKSLSTQKILVQERLEGVRVNDLKALDAAGIDRKAVVALGAKAFFKSIMIDGLFHGDLHGGNLFVLPGNKLGIIDFGIVGRLSERSRDQLATMVMALLTEDYENLCYTYAELGSADASIDLEGFQREVRNALSPYMGLSLDQVNVGRVLIEATKIATKYQVKVPGDWMLVFKAILTVEGMGRTLDPEFDLIAMGQELIQDLVAKRYAPERVIRDLSWITRDTMELLRILPRQLRWMLKKFNSNDFALEIKSPQIESLRETMDRNGKRVSHGIVAAGLLIAGSISLNFHDERTLFGYPWVSVVLLTCGAYYTFRVYFRT
ncbi:MAG: AarF/ABC1/UbiB kinase family protein [Bdellovibrionales bacterium]|nr:AarF/ABC1/UbiB kinase family protein [Bdellovibrionales bacterium]